MSSPSSCIIQEFPIPNRTYRAAPPERWDDFSPPPPSRRAAPSRRRRRRKARLTPLVLAGLALFCCGFLLGRVAALPEVTADDVRISTDGLIQPEEPAGALLSEDGAPDSGGVRILGVPGAILSDSPAEKNAGTIQPEPPAEKAVGAIQPEPPAEKNAGTIQPEPPAEKAVGATQPEPPAGTAVGAIQPEPPAGTAVGAIQPEPPADAVSSADWNLLLVNGDHPLPEGFQVPELTKLRNGHAIDSRAYPSLQAMMDAARAAGCRPLICSSYRTWDKQNELYENKVASCMAQGFGREEAEKQAAVWVARPGTSEHQAGLAVDIVDTDYQLLDQAQEDRPVQRWLMEHCAEYGFILRYPTDKSALTGVGYEPWHYRYVGTEAAKAIMNGGLCLEEYVF